MMVRGVLAIACAIPLWAQDSLAIRGRVVDDIAHRGVSRARLSLAGEDLRTPIATFSDDQGAFQFAGVAAGHYRLSIEKAGFFSEIPYGQVQVTPGAATAVPDIVLTTKRTISGTIHFRDNVAAFRADVRVVNVSGGKAGSTSRGATVNEQGEFVVSDLRPGRYIVSAMSTGAPQQSRDVYGDLVPAVPGRASGPTFPSGTSDVSGAIDLRTTAEASRLEITLDEQPPGVDVEGKVDLSGIPAPQLPPDAGTQLPQRLAIVILAYAGNPPTTVRQMQTAPDGSFKFPTVPAGKYILVVPIPQLATLPIEVATQPLRGLTITPGEVAPTNGKIEIEGPTPQGNPPPPASIRIQTRAEVIPLTNQLGVSPQGEFRLNGSRGEAYDLTFVNVPPSMYIAQITQGDHELPGGIGVRAGGEAVRVVLKQDGATLDGRVLAGTQPGSKAFVVLAPADRTRRDLFRTSVADAQGSFRIQTVAPGTYSLLALDRNEDDDYLDPGSFRTWEDRTVTVKLDPSSSKTIELQLIRLR